MMEMPFDLKVAEASVSRGKIGPAVLHFNKLLRETPSAYNRAFLLFKQGLLFKSYLCLDLAAMCFEQIVIKFYNLKAILQKLFGLVEAGSDCILIGFFFTAENNKPK